MNRSPSVRSLLVSAAILAAIALAGCQTDGSLPTNAKAMAPLSPSMVADIEQKNMDKDSPILVRTFKQEAELEVWKQDRTGRFALLKTYPICRWSGELGPKIKEGDRQAPEGFYAITPAQMNPNSAYYLSFDLGYPNAFDRAHGRTGANLMVHGDCSSRGCYSMTDEQIAEIYALGREAFFGGQRSFQVQAYPFHMTPANFAKHRNNPNLAFWKMLKTGSDHFEITHLEPKVNVCEKHYVFDAQAPGDTGKPLAFNASAKCPTYEVPEDIVSAVKDKQRQDDHQYAQLVSRGVPVAPVLTHADGGMNPVFAAAVKRNELGVAPSYSLASLPGTIPATVNPPHTAEFDNAPVVAGSAPAPEAVQVATTADVAGGGSVRTPVAGSNSNFFGSLFSANDKSDAEKPTAYKKPDSPLDRMAKLMGLRGSSDEDAPKPPVVVPTPAPKPKVAARHVPNGAIRPKPAETEPQAKPTEAAQQQPAPPPARVAEQQTTAQAPANGTMQGSAAIMPAGNFASRWGALR